LQQRYPSRWFYTCILILWHTEKYPPPVTPDGRLPAPCESFQNLKFALESPGNKCGCPIISNGSNNNKNRVFLCAFRNRGYRPRKKTYLSSDPDYQLDSMVNLDKAERREQGKSKGRRTSTKICLPGPDTHNFRIVVAWDEIGFYLKQQTGCPYHSSHSKSAHEHLSIPTRLIPPETAAEEDEDSWGDDWGGLEEDTNPTTPHNRYYDTVKHSTHEACDLLDNVHLSVSPSCAVSLQAKSEIFG